jgi:hypothetical protein
MGERNPILIGQAEEISLVPERIQRMLDNEGFYIGSAPAGSGVVGEAPLVSLNGKIFSMTVDQELDPTRFITGHQLDGPFRAGTPSLLTAEDILNALAALPEDQRKEIMNHFCQHCGSTDPYCTCRNDE